jgi:ankyrin repeat protein
MSSYLGLGPLETTEHIYSDHMDMCRFPHATDPEYLKVAAALRRMTTGTALRSGEKTHSPAESSPMLSDTQREALLQSLRFSQLDSRLLSVRAAHAKTCSWFLESTAYLEWLDSRKLGDHHGFFWIKAKPGAGKSTLMKFVLTKYRRKFRNGVSFFFNARGAELERTTVGMYRSLLLQILETRPHLCQAFDAAEIAPWNATNDHVWSVESLKRVFEEVVHLLGTSDSVACFIDALDECPETEIRDMVEFFEDLGNYAILNHIGFRVLFSSRHYPHVTICKALDMVLEAQDEHLGDIRKYVESRLKITAKSVEFRAEILARIQEKASGVFMWVVLVVDILNKSHDEGRPSGYIRKKLEDLPGDLSELFRDILMRDLHHKDELLLCLQWILFARRPLMPQELCCAINIATESQPLPKSDLDDDRVELFILNSSKGLAEIIKTRAKGTPKTKDAHDAEEKPEAETRTVQFIHESVRDFLLKEGGLRTLWPHLGDAFVAESHDRLKNCCLMYINIPNILESVGEQKNSTNIADADNELPFLQYATQSVLFHADAAAAGGISQDDWLRNFPLPRWSSLHNTCERYRARRYSKNVTLLYILAENNLGALIPVQASISGQNGLEIEADRFGLPLFAALATKSKKSALAILQIIAQAEQSLPKLHDLCGIFGQRVSGKWDRSFRFVGKLGLVWNALQQRDDLVALFLLNLSLGGRLSFQIEQINGYETPLMHAAGWPMESVVRALLEAGANIEARDNNDQTAILVASRWGHYAVIRALVEAGADIEAKDNSGRTALSWAASKGQQDIAEILLQNGANIDIQDDYGRTPLSWAAGYTTSNERTVEMLLKGGAEIDTKDKDGRTPLSWAAGYTTSNERTVEMLLKGGAEIDTKDKNGRTPLDWAPADNRHRMAELFAATQTVRDDRRDD